MDTDLLSLDVITAAAALTLYSVVVAEPTNDWKGLLARAHMYMALAYANIFTCCDNDAVNKAELKPW